MEKWKEYEVRKASLCHPWKGPCSRMEPGKVCSAVLLKRQDRGGRMHEICISLMRGQASAGTESHQSPGDDPGGRRVDTQVFGSFKAEPIIF